MKDPTAKQLEKLNHAHLSLWALERKDTKLWMTQQQDNSK